MAFKVSEKHWEVIANFMQKNTDLAKGKFNGPSGRDCHKRLWATLTLQLNAIGLGERPPDKWQKTWTDFKYNLKKKASACKADIYGTGGGPAKAPPLTEIEEKILNILGSTFHAGIGRAESGISPQQHEDFSIVDNNSINNINEVELIDLDKENDFPVSTSPKRETSHLFQIRSDKKRSSVEVEDHDYLKIPGSKKKRFNPGGTSDELYIKTITVLKDIKNILINISSSLEKIAGAIESLVRV